MSGRSRRADVARETLAILERGEYLAPGGTVVSIRADLVQARAGTVHYAPASFAEVTARRDALLRTWPRTATAFEVVHCTTLAAARSLCGSDDSAGVLALSFASSKHPGGFVSGARSQEGSLMLASGLYACLAPIRRPYEANQGCASGLYTDHMVYVPRVPVFRDDQGSLLRTPYQLSIVSVPAVNVGVLRPDERAQVAPAMFSRIDKLLSLAVVHGHRTLVLGAWGCGGFGNDPSQVAGWFHEHLVKKPTFAGVFEQVVFAIQDWSRDRRFIEPFERQFAPH